MPYVGASDFPDDRLFADDADDNTEPADGCTRKPARPLKKIHVPVHEISMMMSIALRFIPILLEETDKIMKAQMARGADFERKYYPESKEHGAASGAAVYFSIPPCK